MEFLVLPKSATLTGAAGALGARMFEKADMELDAAHSKLNLFASDHCPEKVVYWTKTGFAELPFKKDMVDRITTNMVLDGVPVSVSLRTSGQSDIGMNAMRRLFKLDETAPGMTVVETKPDGQKLYRYPFKTLTADGLTVANPNILILGQQIGEECNGAARPKDAARRRGMSATRATRSSPAMAVRTCSWACRCSANCGFIFHRRKS